MTKEEAKLVLDNARPQTKEIDRQFYDDEDLNNALDMAIKALEQQPNDFVPLEVYKQVTSEKDIAIEQLRELGYSFGEKITTSEDSVSRTEVQEVVRNTIAKYIPVLIGRCEKIPLELAIAIRDMLPVTPTQSWIPLVWDEYPTVDIDGNDDYVYAVDYSVPMPKEDELVLITDENHNVVTVQYDGYDFGDYAREEILAWQPLPKPYEEKRGSEND